MKNEVRPGTSTRVPVSSLEPYAKETVPPGAYQKSGVSYTKPPESYHESVNRNNAVNKVGNLILNAI